MPLEVVIGRRDARLSVLFSAHAASGPSGSTGNPAILSAAGRLAPTDRPDVGYAMCFPATTIVKIIAVQVLLG